MPREKSNRQIQPKLIILMISPAIHITSIPSVIYREKLLFGMGGKRLPKIRDETIGLWPFNSAHWSSIYSKYSVQNTRVSAQCCDVYVDVCDSEHCYYVIWRKRGTLIHHCYSNGPWEAKRMICGCEVVEYIILSPLLYFCLCLPCAFK